MEPENAQTGETEIHGKSERQGQQLRDSEGRTDQHGSERPEGHDHGYGVTDGDTGRSLQGRTGGNDGHSAPAQQSANEISEAWYQLGFSLARSQRYHAKRRQFFARCNHGTRVLLALASATAVATILNEHQNIAIAMGILIALATSLDLVFDFSQRTMEYDALYRHFADLNIKFALAEPSRENCRLFMVERLTLEKEEPTKLAVLDVICQNDELKARGFDYFHKIRFWQRFFAPIFDVGPCKFEEVKNPAPLPTPA